MLKNILVVIAVFAVALSSFAQKTGKERISGIVKTMDGKLVECITVSLKNTTYGSITNENGTFEFDAPAGEYTLVVYSIAAHKKEYPVVIKAGAANYFPDLTVIENKNQLEEVVVTGQLSPQSLRNSVYKVRVINNEQIQQKAATNVQTLLNTEIGIRMSNDMALGETDFEIMGMSGNNVKVLIDGIPMLDRRAAKQSLSQIDVNTIERIEIIEGPMSVTYGADALAGVINIITKKGVSDGKNLSVFAKIQEESIGDEYDFFGGEGSHIQNVGATYRFNNGLYATGSFTHNDFGGWQGDSIGRKKQWQPKEQILVGGKAGYATRNLSISYRLDYLNENILTKADVNSVTNTTSDKEFIVDRYTHQFQADWMLNNKVSFEASGAYQDYHRKTKTVTINLNTGKKELSLDDGAQAVIDYSDFFSRIAMTWKPLHNLTVQPGVEYQSTQGTGDRVDGDRRINNTAIFLSAEYNPVEWVSIRPGVRTSFNSAYDVPWAVPALNLKFNISEKTDLRVSYGRGFRAPTLQELYYSFHDANHDIDGNPDLKAEHSNSYMASFTFRPLHDQHIRLTSTLSGFYNEFRDQIAMVRDPSTNFYIYENIDRYKTLGLTFENAVAWKSLRANLSFSYIGRYNKLYKDEDYESEDMSEFRFSPEIAANITYDLEKIATFSFFYKMTGRRYEYTTSDDGVALTGMSSFNWADLTATRKINKFLTAQVGVKNIFDITTVRNTASSGGSAHSSGTGVSMMACGRSYFVGLSFNY